jgi:phage shock protein E
MDVWIFKSKTSALKMKKILKNNRLLLAGVTIGAFAGFLYWQQIGCISGTCAITSTWHNSTAYGAIMGGLLFSMLQEKKENEQ